MNLLKKGEGKMFQPTKKFVAVMMVMLLLVVGGGQVLAAPPQQAAMDIIDTAVADGRFTTLATALTEAGLIDTLKGPGPFTVFAPTDDAFAKLPAGALEDLLADKAALTQVLTYHVVSGKVMAADVVNLTSADTVAGMPVSIKVDGGNVFLNDASQVVITDIETSNGVIHVIDTVLLPPAEAPAAMEEPVMAASETVCAESYVVQADDTMGLIANKFLGNTQAYNLIVEATNAAAAADATYTSIDDPNIINVGQALCIPGSAEETAAAGADDTAMEKPVMAEGPTIVDLAIENGRFTSLVSALQAAELVDTLKGPGPFTVFAPNDEAFAKIPQADLQGLLGDVPTLQEVLTYHVVSGKLLAGDVIKLGSADTVAGKPITIKTLPDGRVLLNDNAFIIGTDIQGSNGVIHIIDNVLFPPAGESMGDTQPLDIIDTAVADGRFTTLATALTEAGLIDTLKGPGPFTVFAPTDDAFAKLPAGALEDLLADKAALTQVLTYHVVSGKVMAADVVNLTSADTVAGMPVSIKVDGGNVFLNDASQVVITDIETSNGVIHVIDTVLLPPAEPAPAAPQAAPQALPATGGELSTSITMFAAALGLGLVLLMAGLALRLGWNR
ncbi:MAG: hypothetical protein DPW09_25590 [Anaerolineae bacterium]|nr:hypothetical protein [Anaerolineae bacterium]